MRYTKYVCGCEDHDDLFNDMDAVCDALCKMSSMDINDAAEYFAKNLNPITLDAFKEGLNRVKV